MVCRALGLRVAQFVSRAQDEFRSFANPTRDPRDRTLGLVLGCFARGIRRSYGHQSLLVRRLGASITRGRTRTRVGGGSAAAKVRAEARGNFPLRNARCVRARTGKRRVYYPYYIIKCRRNTSNAKRNERNRKRKKNKNRRRRPLFSAARREPRDNFVRLSHAARVRIGCTLHMRV
uniref:Uncharacterized protein n=1 Tax=Sipha flava TaxID=143950 RepID=A0A2S2QRD1_9HEMI